MKQKLLTLLFICLGLGSSKCLADTQPTGPNTLPDAPTEHPSDVIAVFSDYYIPVVDQIEVLSGLATKPQVEINGNSVDMFKVLSWETVKKDQYSDIEFRDSSNSAFSIDLTDCTTLEMDVFSCGYISETKGLKTLKGLKLKVGLGTNKTSKCSEDTIPTGVWTHITMPLGDQTRNAISSLRIYPQTPGWNNFSEKHNANLYIYNIYFKKSTTTGNVVGESTATVPVTSAGWASVCFPYDVTIPDGVEAYYAKAAAGSTITLAKVMDMIPAGKGVIVKASEGNVEFTKTEGAAAIAGNLFVGTTSAGLVNQGENYVLSGVNGGNPVFKLFSEGNGKVCMPPFKAYLPSGLVGSGARTLNFVFEEETNAIRNVVEKTQNYKKVMENGRFFIYHCDKKYNAAGQLMKQ